MTFWVGPYHLGLQRTAALALHYILWFSLFSRFIIQKKQNIFEFIIEEKQQSYNVRLTSRRAKGGPPAPDIGKLYLRLAYSIPFTTLPDDMILYRSLTQKLDTLPNLNFTYTAYPLRLSRTTRVRRQQVDLFRGCAPPPPNNKTGRGEGLNLPKNMSTD